MGTESVSPKPTGEPEVQPMTKEEHEKLLKTDAVVLAGRRVRDLTQRPASPTAHVEKAARTVIEAAEGQSKATELSNREKVGSSQGALLSKEYFKKKNMSENEINNYVRVLELIIKKSEDNTPNFSDLEIFDKDKLPLRKIMVDHFDLLETIIGKQQAQKLIPERLYLYILDQEQKSGASIDIDKIISYLKPYDKKDIATAMKEHYDDIFEGDLRADKATELKEKLASELGIVVTKS